MHVSKTWLLLEQEGLLAHACLCNGLTALRKASLGNKKGVFYSAFFELSIGFERTMKLILILDRMAQNQLSPPDGKFIRRYGHQLRKLFKDTKSIGARLGVTTLQKFQSDSLEMITLEFLDMFADTDGRYSNIDQLTGHHNQAISDPMRRWGEIADNIMRNHATATERKRAQSNGQVADAAIGDISISLINDMDQRNMGIAELHTRSSELETAARYANYALVTLIAALREVIESVSEACWKVETELGFNDTAHIPHMREFFDFAWIDKNHVLRKRKWP